MDKLEQEQKQTRILYRELFLKANKGFKEQINNLKTQDFCTKQGTCCKIRYSGLSPSEIYNLKQEGDNISAEYVELFLPYGHSKDFNFEKNNHVDHKLNNDIALSINKPYVSKILAKLPGPVYFYYCKNLHDNKCSVTSNRKSEYYLCSHFPASATILLPDECGFREWQKLALNKIKNEISKDILVKLKEIDLYRQQFECKRTGTCCRLASSEFSYEELQEKAKKGDNFAKQFTSIFIPYNSIEEARKIFPEYISMVESQLDSDENIYFYHCPHVTDDNLCSMYEDRPQICKDFPNNPLAILPPQCGFCAWKEEVNVAAMLLHALVEIADFNIQKIEAALAD